MSAKNIMIFYGTRWGRRSGGGKIHEVDHGTHKHLQLQFYNVPVESFEISLSLDHCHTKLSVPGRDP